MDGAMVCPALATRLLLVYGPLIRRRLYAIDSVLRQFLDCGISTTPINDRSDRRRESRDCWPSRETLSFRESRNITSRNDYARNAPAMMDPPAPTASYSPGSREPTKSEVGTIDYTLERDESENTDRYM